MVSFLAEKLKAVPIEHIFMVSALQNTGTEDLLSCLEAMAPEGEAFYPDEYYTDQEVPFRVAEIIREKAMNSLYDEIPHQIYVDASDCVLQDARDGKKLIIRAVINVERESQKGIVVGAGGSKIREIRLAALKELRGIFDWDIVLELRVKVSKDWRNNDKVLKILLS
jgi:GTP-binding protein Era